MCNFSNKCAESFWLLYIKIFLLLLIRRPGDCSALSLSYSHSWHHVKWSNSLAVILFVIVPCVLCLLALHTNYHAYNLHEPKCVSGSGDAIHAESVHHHFPPWTQCPETEAKLQGGSHSSHHVIAAVTQTQWQTQRWGQDRALWKRRPKQ